MPRSAPTQLSVALPLAWNVASRKTTVSNPSRSTARKAMATSALDVPVARADCGLLLEIVLQVPGVPTHPEDHVGDHHDGDQADHRLEPLLLPLGEIVRDDLQRHADSDADHDRDGNADPDLAQGRLATLLAQEGGHDAHDEGGLHAFSEPDDERR